MKKTLFLLVALLGVVGMANATVEDFTLVTPSTLATNTLSIDQSLNATTQEFTVSYYDEVVTFAGTVTVVDASNNDLGCTVTVNPVAGKKNVFTATIDDATALPVGNKIYLAFPEGCFTAATTGTTNKKFGVHLDVAKCAEFAFEGSAELPVTYYPISRTYLVPNEYVKPDYVYGKVTGPTFTIADASGFGGYTIDPTTGKVTVDLKTLSASKNYTIPAGSLKTVNANGSTSYNKDLTFSVVLYEQYIDMDIKDKANVSPYNVNNQTTTLTLQFFDHATNNPIDNIDSSDLIEFLINGVTYNGKVIGHSSSDDAHKTFTVELDEKLPAGEYIARMNFAKTLSETTYPEYAMYQYVYARVTVYQKWAECNKISLDQKALSGEDIYNYILGAKFTVKDIKTNNVLSLIDSYTYAYNEGKPATYVAPYVSNAFGFKCDVAKLNVAEDGTYTVDLGVDPITNEPILLDAGKGYIITFPAQSICWMATNGNMEYNKDELSVNLDILHAYAFNDATTTTDNVDAKADTYEVIHYTRNYNGNLQGAYLPFDLVITDKLDADVDFYQINAAYLDEANVPHLKANKMPVGKTVKAYLPYLIKAKNGAGEVKYDFAGQLKAAPATPGSVVTSTAFATYTFTGTTTGNLKDLLPEFDAVGNPMVYMLVGNGGGINDLTADQRKAYNQEYTGANAKKNKTISAWRFYVTRDESTGYDQFVDYSKLVIDEDETTGIDAVESNVENGAMFNVAGQRISAPVKGQVYIMNGKKYIAK